MTAWDTVMDPGNGGHRQLGVGERRISSACRCRTIWAGCSRHSSSTWERACSGPRRLRGTRGLPALPIVVSTIYALSYMAPRRIPALQVGAFFGGGNAEPSPAHAGVAGKWCEGRVKTPEVPTLRCSFCYKPRSTTRKLIASGKSDPRAYICDECIAVCNRIIEDEEEVGNEQDASTSGRFVNHPLAIEFLETAERWAACGCPAGNASEQLNDLRSLAIRMLVKDAP